MKVWRQARHVDVHKLSLSKFDWIGLDICLFKTKHKLFEQVWYRPHIGEVGASFYFLANEYCFRYKLADLFDLIHTSMARFFVEHKNYNRILLNTKLDSSFTTKGLIYDSHLGNFLKLDEKHRVLFATHGRFCYDIIAWFDVNFDVYRLRSSFAYSDRGLVPLCNCGDSYGQNTFASVVFFPYVVGGVCLFVVVVVVVVVARIV